MKYKNIKKKGNVGKPLCCAIGNCNECAKFEFVVKSQQNYTENGSERRLKLLL